MDPIRVLVAQVEALIKKFDSLRAPRAAMMMQCDTYNGGHASFDCPIVVVISSSSPSLVEHVDFVSNANRPQENPYSNSYNLG